MLLFSSDIGHVRFKGYDGARDVEFEHAIAKVGKVDSSAVRRFMNRDNTTPKRGYVVSNGMVYAVGEKARRHQIVKREGSNRYTDDYYLPMFHYGITQSSIQDGEDVFVVATHAPQDEPYAGDIEDLLMGTHEVSNEFGLIRFNVIDVLTLDEPVSGLYNYVLTYKGSLDRRKTESKEWVILVVDVGGQTTDLTAVDSGFEIDESTIESVEIGALRVIESFWEVFKDENKSQLKNVSSALPMRAVEQAIITDKFPYGVKHISCKDIAHEARNLLLNDVIDLINSMGGAVNYNAILLTGGGSMLIERDLSKAFPMMEILTSMPEGKLDKQHLANAHGAYKSGLLYADRDIRNGLEQRNKVR